MGRAATKVRRDRSNDADLPTATSPGLTTKPDARSDKAKKTRGGKGAGPKAPKAELKKSGAGKSDKKSREPSIEAVAGTPAGATNSVVDAIIAAALGEAVAESLTASLAESINESFTEMMAGGLAGALEEALVEAVSTAVARDLPDAFASVAVASLTGQPAVDLDAPGSGAGSTAPAVTPPGEPGGRPAAGSASSTRTAPGPARASDGHAVEVAAARSLWEALPPRRLPVLPSLDLAARRLAASDPDRVGGDWYDAIALDADAVVLGVGDVAGHGPGMAAQMAELCHAARAYALLDLPPAQITGRLTEVLRAGGHRSLASTCTARLDIPTGRLTWCNAGHPPPVLITAQGDVSFLGDVHGPLLGAAPGAGPGTSLAGGPGVEGGTEYAQSTVTLPSGATVLFYAAGLVDQPDAPIAHRLDALATAASKAFGTAASTSATGSSATDTSATSTSASGGVQPGVDVRPLAAACDALLTELSTARAASSGQSDAARQPRPRRDSDSVLLAARLR
ncbi:PP2C family protein-serine/threonine phosphatase [Pseudofrankia inefficax]|uniref:Protein serine/threonine phosphatase n=1 Tax=Pseudofrankia inefficax (strain DSM 45817 / CECT 9037 / DDB 130130 / EuI1c) TaxID=298654 RepID=E3J1W0_PSEI1|nr:PP2C family protein-serine/threonine phosphatase [Pseudofrankia inefficax]ADP82918.1 protein serine/threonine phosphatase [Pseudofrankia inefficax]